MKKQFTRVLSLVLCVLLCATLLPFSALAAGEAKDGEVAANATKYRALLIGELHHDNEDDGYAARMKGDVLQMKKLLSSVKGGNGGKYSVTAKYDRTNSQIHSLIKKTFKGAKKTDVSLFFISTHGVVGQSKTSPWAGALVTTNTKGTYHDYLQLGTLAGWLKKVPGKVIVIISSCSSGSAIVKEFNGQYRAISSAKDAAAFDNAVINTFAAMDEPVDDGTASNGGPFRNKKFYVLTASQHDEESWGWETYDNDPTLSHNFMPYYMRLGVTGKKPADSNKNKKITLKELYTYTRKKCISECKKYNLDPIQHVQVYPTNCSFVIFK